MAIDDILHKDLKDAHRHLTEVKVILDRIYYSDRLIIFFKKTTISLMSTAVDFLISNMRVITTQYKAKILAKEDK